MLEQVDIARAMEVVSEVSVKAGYVFEPEDVSNVIRHTARKCDLNGKDVEYFYILLENELRDFLVRASVNALGELNRRRKELCAMFA